MNEQEAMQLLTNVCAGVQGNLKDHQLIQEALKTVNDKVTSVPPKKEKVTKKK